MATWLPSKDQTTSEPGDFRPRPGPNPDTSIRVVGTLLLLWLGRCQLHATVLLGLTHIGATDGERHPLQPLGEGAFERGFGGALVGRRGGPQDLVRASVHLGGSVAAEGQ